MSQIEELAPGSLILITGVTGWVASHVTKQLLDHPSNFRVHGTTRSTTKGDFLVKVFASYGADRFSYEVVEDLAVVGAWDKVVGGCKPDAIAHIASPFAMSKDLDPAVLVKPAVEGTLSLVRAAGKVPSVKRIVQTGSLSAVWLCGKKPGELVDESDWNIVSPAKIADPNDPDRGFHAYFASKTAAEKAAWKYMEEEKPSFTLSVVLPTHILGPMFNYTPNQASLNSGTRRIATWLEGSVDKVLFTGSPMHEWVDVRDVAAIHVKLLVSPPTVGQRYLATAGSYTLSDVARILKRLYPERHLPEPSAEEEAACAKDTNPLSRERVSTLGHTFKTLEECIKDTADAILALEARGWDKA